jgi:hypothetical protein
LPKLNHDDRENPQLGEAADYEKKLEEYRLALGKTD